MGERQINRRELRRQNQKHNKRRKNMRALLVVALALVVTYITGIYGASLAYLGDFFSSGITLIQFGKGWPVSSDFQDFLQAEDMGTALCVLTGDELQFYSPTGKKIFGYSHSMVRPVVATSKNRAVFYDENQTTLKVSNSHNILFQQEMGNSIVHADISKSNRVAVTTRSANYNGEVTVFNFNMVPRFTWYCATGYPVYSKLSPDGNALAVLALQTHNGLLQNQIYFIDAQHGKEIDTSIWDTYPVDMIFLSDTKLLAVFTNFLILFDVKNGDVVKSFNFDTDLIKAVEIKGQNIVISHSPYGRTNKSEITLLSRNLEEKFTVDVNDDIKNISISQSRIFALGTNNLYEYNFSLENVNTISANGFAKALVDFNGTTLITSTGAEKVEKTRSK